ncbi:MAG: replication associated protein [Wigfec virus K19_645]|nr:MAG: replication associated protein [Wigfec virus K19_645]
MSRCRAFTFTINTFDEETEEKLQAHDCRYIIYGYELAPTTGRPHFQGYVYYDNARTPLAVSKDIKGHIEVAKGAPDQNYDYCSKDGSYYERGLRPISDKAKGINEKERFKRARESAIAGDFASIPDDLYTRYQASYKRMRREDAPRPTDLEKRDTYGVWIYGPPRTGKSHKARHDYGDVYLKDINKWWDAYDGQANVLIDELAPEHAPFMTNFLKKWVDRWTFSAECKGGRILARPQLIIVTSNYSIQEVFPSGIDRDAILSRFEVIHIPFPTYV